MDARANDFDLPFAELTGCGRTLGAGAARLFLETLLIHDRSTRVRGFAHHRVSTFGIVKELRALVDRGRGSRGRG